MKILFNSILLFLVLCGVSESVQARTCIWADGKPVTERDNPFLSFYNSKAEYINITLNRFKVGNDGQFSFSLFEEYTYLVEIEVNTKTGGIHSFAKIKVDKNLKPVKIVLHRNGFGKAEDYLKDPKNIQQ